jgi:hypothetical protein
VAYGAGAALRHAVRYSVARDYAVRNASILSAGGVELDVTCAVTASHPRRAPESMKAAAMETTTVKTTATVKATTTVKATAMKASGVETATSTTMKTAAVKTAAATMTTTAAMTTTTAAMRRISWIREWCCHNRSHEDRDSRQ